VHRLDRPVPASKTADAGGVGVGGIEAEDAEGGDTGEVLALEVGDGAFDQEGLGDVRER
jgi:hypothetical protein